MSKIGLYSLDIKCMSEIFQQIKYQCEAETYNKIFDDEIYADLRNFAISSDWVAMYFYDWNKYLFRQLKVRYPRIDTLKMFDFGFHYQRIQNEGKNYDNEIHKSIIAVIKSPLPITMAFLMYNHGSYYHGHLDIFRKVIEALRTKQELGTLQIHDKGYSLEPLPRFANLENLHLDVRMEADVLVECCKLHPNLRKLYTLSNDIYGRLADIARFGDLLQKLELLQFKMKDEVDAAEYAPLAKLPMLNHLIVDGVHEIGSLKHLFQNLAANGTLSRLSIKEARLNEEETKAICQIGSLEKLRFVCTEPEYIGHLTELKNLRWLNIISTDESSKIRSEILKLLKETNVPNVQISFAKVAIEYTEISKELTCKYGSISSHDGAFDGMTEMEFAVKTLEPFDLCILPIYKEISEVAAVKSIEVLNCHLTDVSDLDLLGQLPHLRQLSLVIPTILQVKAKNELEKLFRALAFRPTRILDFLDISGVLIDLSLAKELARIGNLRHLRCGFSDPQAISLLGELTKLEELEIWSIHEFSCLSKMMSHILALRHNNIDISCKSFNRSMQYNRESNSLEVTLIETVNAFFYAKVENSEKLYIFGDSKMGSFESLFALFRSLATKMNNNGLKELRIHSAPRKLEWNALCENEFGKELDLDIAKIRFDDSINEQLWKDIAQIDLDVDQITNLLSTFCGNIHISNMLGEIEYDRNHEKLTLTSTHIKVFKFNESDFDFLGSLNSLQTLYIEDPFRIISLKPLLSALATRPFQTLKELIMKQEISVSSAALGNIAQIKSLRKLECEFMDTYNMEALPKLEELQELTITEHRSGSLRKVLQQLSLRPVSALHRLTIQKSALTSEELDAISHIRSLTELDCIFDNRDGLPSFSHLKILRIKRQLKTRLFKVPEFYVSSSLQELFITGYPLSDQDIAAVAQHKLLKTLDINLEKIESIDLLSSLTSLQNLCIQELNYLKSQKIPLKSLKIPLNVIQFTIRNLIIANKDIEKVICPLQTILQLQTKLSFDIMKDSNSPVLEINCVHDKFSQRKSITNLQINTLSVPLSEETSLEAVLNTLKTASMLQDLTIKQTVLNKAEYLQLLQISSLTRLECIFENAENAHDLKQLKNLKYIKITFDCFVGWQDFYPMLKECKQLQIIQILINMSVGAVFKLQGGIREALHDIEQILKGVRNPAVQKPLEILYNFDLNHNTHWFDKRYLVLRQRDGILPSISNVL